LDSEDRPPGGERPDGFPVSEALVVQITRREEAKYAGANR
jgi:hypothetical protein